MSDERNMTESSLMQKAAVFAPTAIGLTGLELFLQAPLPLEFAFLATAGVLAWKSPEILASLRSHYPDNPVVEQISRMQVANEAKTDWTLGDKLLGKHYQGAYQPVQQSRSDGHQEEVWDFEGDDEIALPTRRSTSTLFTLSDVLRDFKPSIDRIYLGEREDGSPVFCSAKKLFHVALAGKSGRGKGSLMRLLLAQLCALRLDILLLNPHYAPWVYTDSGMDEDWTPFLPYLKKDPLECVEVPDIEATLRWCVDVLFEKRKAKFRAGQRPGRPFFIVIDELKEIIDGSKRCADYISRLTNGGRKYGIFIIVASQNFQVKSVSGDNSGADRENYETCYYVGGDGTTAKVLLDMPANQIPETSLGKGVAMLRCAGSPEAEKAVKVRVPFTDNEALYKLLGPSTFQRGEGPNTDDLADFGSKSASLAQEPATERQSFGLEALMQLLAEDKIDLATFQRLLDKIEVTEVDVSHLSESQSPVDEELERAIEAYQNGAKTLDAMAAAFGDKSNTRARRLMPHVRKALGISA